MVSHILRSRFRFGPITSLSVARCWLIGQCFEFKQCWFCYSTFLLKMLLHSLTYSNPNTMHSSFVFSLETFPLDQRHETMFGHVLFIFLLNRTLILLRSGVSFHWRVNPLQSAWAIKTNVFKSQRDCQDRLILCKFPGYKMATRVSKGKKKNRFLRLNTIWKIVFTFLDSVYYW